MKRLEFALGLLILTFMCVSVSAHALHWIYPTPVIKITQKSPLFEKASARSESLGLADAETPVLARALSPNETWLLVEDSEGNRAWIPIDRSNFKEIRMLDDKSFPSLKQDVAEGSPSPNPSKDNLPLAPEPIPPLQASSEQVSKRIELGLGWSYVWTGRDPDSPHQMPLSLGYLEAAPKGDRLGLRLTYDPLEVQMFQANFVARYLWGRSGFFREFDAGYERQWRGAKNSSQSALNLGYSMGFYLTPLWSLALRGGLFLAGRSQWSGGMLLRCFVY